VSGSQQRSYFIRRNHAGDIPVCPESRAKKEEAMKIIVTGGAGFIGGNFVHHMVKKYPDYEIINLDLLTYAGNLETLKPVEDKPNYKFVKGDIADREFI
jgi:FlaA1/EpsC-like NDP-sugar epimerase